MSIIRRALAALCDYFSPPEPPQPDPELVAGITREARPFGPGVAAEIVVEYPESLAARKIRREISTLETGKVAPINRRSALSRVK